MLQTEAGDTAAAQAVAESDAEFI